MSTQPLDLPTLTQTLKTHLRQRSDLPDLGGLHLFAHGEANIIFRLDQTRLVRVAVNTPNQRFEGNIQRVTQFEYGILRYLAGTEIGHDVQAAHLEATSACPYTYLVTNYLEGVPLDYSRSHLHACAHTLAHLHRLPQLPAYALDRLPNVPLISHPLTLFYQEAQDYAQPYLASPTAEPEIIEMIQAVLDRAKARLEYEPLLADNTYRCLVHSDHTYENWVINPQRAYLVDWEWAEIGSPAGDLGHFLSPVTICRRQGSVLSAADRAFFLQSYYEALEDADLAARLERHFAAFGVFPAVRSLCWTAGYWITANPWYARANTPNASDRVQRLQESRQQFPMLWQAVMDWLDEPV